MANSKIGSAVQIASIQSGKVRIRLNDLLPILDKVSNLPLAIVSVNGPLRTGKSYLLGHFMRFLGARGRGTWIHEKLMKEFDWKSSSQRQTSGILVWSEPYLLDKSDQQIAVLLLDTQGSFDEQTDYSINYMLFALSCLLSSVLVYNVMHQMSEDVLQFLQMFLGFARMPLEDGVDEPFASLVMLIRDWQSPVDYAYGYHDKGKPKEKNFLKEKMEVGSHMAEDVKNVHSEVFGSFQSVACCLLPHPGKGLATKDKTDNLDEEFVDALEEFVPRVCAAENIVLKTIGGQVITGFLMGEIVKGWDKLFAKVPFDDIKSLASMAAEKQNQSAMSTAFNVYKKHLDTMKSSNGLSVQELNTLHDKARAEAVKTFKQQKRMKYPSIEEEFLENLEKQIQSAYQSFQEMNAILRKFDKLEAQSEEDKIRLKQEMKAAVEEAEQKMEENAKRDKEEREKLEKNHREEMEARLKGECDEMKRLHHEEMKKKEEELVRLIQEMRQKNKSVEEIQKMQAQLQGLASMIRPFPLPCCII